MGFNTWVGSLVKGRYDSRDSHNRLGTILLLGHRGFGAPPEGSQVGPDVTSSGSVSWVGNDGVIPGGGQLVAR